MRINAWKSALAGSSLVIGLVFAPGSYAAPFNFIGSDDGGTGSATMEFAVATNTLTVTLKNTSPVNLDGFSSGGGNSPGISGFGFDLDPASLSLNSWSLTAYTVSNALVTIGSSGVCNGCDWSMGTTLASITVDYLPNNGGVADGMLFNPAALSDPNNELPGGQNDTFFTTAILTMNFNESPSLNDSGEWSPFVRMQNVGRGGEGSLKLPGSNGNGNGGGGGSVPEPATIALMGLGLVGLATLRRRSKQQ